MAVENKLSHTLYVVSNACVCVGTRKTDMHVCVYV